MTEMLPSPRPATASQADIVAFLDRELGGGRACKRIDTHAASVFLAGDRAWKLKRAVRYSYLDFSTPARRHAALDAELRLNRRTAPDLYLAVHPIVRTATGFHIGGDGEPVDWLLEMRRFPDDALLDTIARKGRIDPRLLINLADRIYTFHASAEVVVRADGADGVRHVIEGNAESLRRFDSLFDEQRIVKVTEAQQHLCRRHAALLDARAREGRVRHTHGDLHLANIALIDGEAVPFDCIEFDDGLATTDILYDLTFLLMDLWHRGLGADANLVFNRYIDISGDEEGVRLLGLFLSLRAAIRAHVLAATAEQTKSAADTAEARCFLTLAEAVLEPQPVALVAIGGLSGSGKSAVARAIGGEFGAAPGARILRSDVLRKRLAGVEPEARLPESFYAPLASRTVYDLLADCAGRHLAAGTFTIVDAVFSQAEERARIARSAIHGHVPFVGCWLAASRTNRLDRVTGRSKDASDADAGVVQLQSARHISSPRDWRRIAADAPLAAVAGATCAHVKQVLGVDNGVA
jgi:aminoglycoside phosphotransferase family enzyme/predicted kinase